MDTYEKVYILRKRENSLINLAGNAALKRLVVRQWIYNDRNSLNYSIIKTDPSVFGHSSEVLVSLMYGTRRIDHNSHCNCLNTTQTCVTAEKGLRKSFSCLNSGIWCHLKYCRIFCLGLGDIMWKTGRPMSCWCGSRQEETAVDIFQVN